MHFSSLCAPVNGRAWGLNVVLFFIASSHPHGVLQSFVVHEH